MTIDRFACAVCGRQIAKRRSHILTDTDVIVCSRCAVDHGRDAHSVTHPDCPVEWHDLFDHSTMGCSPAALRYLIRKGGFHAARGAT